MKTRISKNLHFIEKYLKRAKKHMPSSLLKPWRVRSYRPSPKKMLRSFGSSSREDRTITLATHDVVIVKGKKRRKKRLVRLNQKQILLTLAHELAHFRYFKHGYEHTSYARTIFEAFDIMDTCPACGGKGMVPAMYRE